MAICIGTDSMTLEIGDRVVATARFSEHTTADGNGAWIVSTHPARLSSRNRAITALTPRDAVTALGQRPVTVGGTDADSAD